MQKFGNTLDFCHILQLLNKNLILGRQKVFMCSFVIAPYVENFNLETNFKTQQKEKTSCKAYFIAGFFSIVNGVVKIFIFGNRSETRFRFQGVWCLKSISNCLAAHIKEFPLLMASSFPF